MTHIAITKGNVVDFELPVPRAQIDKLIMRFFPPVNKYYTGSGSSRTVRTDLNQRSRNKTEEKGMQVEFGIKYMLPNRNYLVPIGIGWGHNIILEVRNKNVRQGDDNERFELRLSKKDGDRVVLLDDYPEIIQSVRYELTTVQKIINALT